jgi:hypothetical protein
VVVPSQKSKRSSYFCVRDIECAYFYDFSIRFWNCSQQCGIFCFLFYSQGDVHAWSITLLKCPICESSYGNKQIPVITIWRHLRSILSTRRSGTHKRFSRRNNSRFVCAHSPPFEIRIPYNFACLLILIWRFSYQCGSLFELFFTEFLQVCIHSTQTSILIRLHVTLPIVQNDTTTSKEVRINCSNLM